MKKVMQFLFGRIFITAILILVQVAWFTVFLLKLTEYSVWIHAAFSLLSLFIVLYLIKNDDNSSFKIGWIVLVMLMPVFGGVLYTLFGSKLPANKMRKRLAVRHSELAPQLGSDMTAAAALQREDLRTYSRSRYITDSSAYPVWQNTSTTYYPLGEEMYAAMLEELEKAESFIFMEYFIIKPGVMWNGILDILKRKAAAGVDVRLICDDMGSLFLLPNGFAKEMESYGIKTLMFNPFVPLMSLVMNNRDHRKITVIDGHTAFNGGINLSDEYINAVEVYGHWKDTGVRIVGDAVWNFTMMFLELWHAYRPESAREDVSVFKPNARHAGAFETDGFVQPFSDSPLDGEALSESVYIDILARATSYVYIFTPYLIISEIMQTALCAAVKRGVDVRLVTPGVPDKKVVYRLTRSYYGPLLKAGVRIYEYTPGFIHAKSYISDDDTGIVGTINMDFRSLYLHFECGTYMYRTSALAALKADALETIAKSLEVSEKEVSRSSFGRLLDAVLRVFAPLC